MAREKKYWLMKTEPESFSIQMLAAQPKQTTFWDGVRNYQARNFMREMRVGEQVLFYHSSADPPAVVGTAVIAAEAYPDHTALDPQGHHYDPKASVDNPIWEMVDIRLGEIFAEPIGLDRLRDIAQLKGMELLRRGSRLSVQPVTKAEFETILELAKSTGPTKKVPAKPAAKSPAKRTTRSK